MYKFFKYGLFFISIQIINAQTYNFPEINNPYADVKSPEAYAFNQLNFAPVNEYSGRTKIEIELYKINENGFEIPIKISYNTGGVNLNVSASCVGLNWSLFYGGQIDRTIKGYSDFKSSFTYNSSSSSAFYDSFGWSAHFGYYTANKGSYQFSYGGFSIIKLFRDLFPDIYKINSIGLNSSFILDKEGKAINLIRDGTAIQHNLIDFEVQNNFSPEFIVTSDKGIIYKFSESETSYGRINTVRSSQPAYNENPPTFWPSSITLQQVIDYFTPYRPNTSNELPNVKLSKISFPDSNKEIIYEYFDNLIVDQNLHMENKFSLTSSANSLTKYIHDFTIEKLIKKISFSKGYIVFNYKDRTDVIKGKKLDNVVVYNKENKIIKRINFDYSYFQSSNCTGSDCLRLKLNSLKFIYGDKSENYEFQYNSTVIPKKFDLNQDFLGYCNGQQNNLTFKSRPKLFKYLINGVNKIIPFQLNTTPILTINPNGYPLTSNLTYAKAGILEKIKYPTGGTTEFVYELNEFMFNGSLIKGGGLRIKEMKIYDLNGKKVRSLNYSYLSNNKSTGILLGLPKYFNCLGGNIQSDCGISQKSTPNFESDYGSYIVYKEVKIYEENNGFRIKKFSNPETIPNGYLFNELNLNLGSTWTDAIKEDKLPNNIISYESLRGDLISEEIYNNKNILINKHLVNFEIIPLNSIDIGENFYTFLGSEPEDIVDVPPSNNSLNYKEKLITYTKRISKDESITYLANGPKSITKKINYIQNDYRPNSVIESSGSNIKISKFKYADNNALSGQKFLIDRNMINIPIERIESINENETKIYTQKMLTSNKVLDKNLTVYKGNLESNKVSYDQYDSQGNVLQYTTQDGVPTAIIWGYGGEYVVAKVVGATYSQAIAKVGGAPAQGLSATQNTALRSLNALVTTYEHIPLVGVKSITDPTGNKTSFEYDGFNRLQYVVDHLGNLVSKNEYKYYNE